MVKQLIVFFICLLICTSGFTYTVEELEQYKRKKVRILPREGLGTIGTVLKIHEILGINPIIKDKYFIELRLMKVFGQSVIFIINADNILSIELLEE